MCCNSIVLFLFFIKEIGMKLLAYILGYWVWLFSLLVPRSRKIWAFGSFRGTFTDNAKYLFIAVSEQCSELFPVWISYKSTTVRQIRTLGLNAYSLFSLQGLYYALRAKFYFFNAYSSDICYFTSGRAVQINLWHGVGLKKIEFCVDKGPMYNRYVKKTLKERFYYPQVYRRPDYFLSSTDFQSVKFAQAFRIQKEQCMNLGYPRNDLLLADESKRMDFIRRFETIKTQQLIESLKTYSQVFLYMPTWRESQRKLFAEHLDLQKLHQLMKKQNALLLLKPHANTIIENPEQLKAYSHVQLIDNSMDIYPILPYTDVLITDYSSILYDYLLLEDKRVILYLYDYEDYVKDRDFNYPFLENVAGDITHTFGDLLEAVKQKKYDRNNYTIIRKKFWGDYKGNATIQIIDKFRV